MEDFLLEQRKRKKEELTTSTSCTISTTSRVPDWLDLPSCLLQTIFHLISSIPDLLSFATVCTQWRSLAKSSLHNSLCLSQPPPLLLSPSFTISQHSEVPPTKNPDPNPTTTTFSVFRCDLKTLFKNYPTTSFQPSITEFILRKRTCFGFSHGHLIFAYTSDVRYLLCATLFSRQKHVFCPPDLPSSCLVYTFRTAIFTAPPSSPSCRLLISLRDEHSRSRIIVWNPHDQDSFEWSVFKFSKFCVLGPMRVFREKVYGLRRKTDGEEAGARFSLVVSDSVSPTSWDEVKVGGFPASLKRLIFLPSLAEVGGELFLLLFTDAGGERRRRSFSECSLLSAEVYRLDFEKYEWVRVKSIGDWCVFMDGIGRCSSSCPDPRRWGGRPNCVYFAGPENGSWNELPLDGTEFPSSAFPKRDVWPVPIWVYPPNVVL